MPTSAAFECTPLESDLLCFTHLRWHWMPSRFHESFITAARGRRVFIIEEPVFVPGAPMMDVETPHENLAVARPCLPYALLGEGVDAEQRKLLDAWLASLDIQAGVAWYHSPAAFAHTAHLQVPMTVYDRVADPAAFPDDRLEVARLERDLLARADVVYAESGAQLERMRRLHSDVRTMPAAGGLSAFFTSGTRAATGDAAPRLTLRRAPSPGDGPREQGTDYLQGTRLEPRTQRGRRWEEPRLERGP